MSAIGNNIGTAYNPLISTQYGQNQIQQQAGLQQTKKAVATNSPLDVGFERGKGKVASEVAQKASQVHNPIVEADESFVDFDAGVAKSASKSSLTAALSMEDFDPNEFGGNGLNNAAASLLEGKFSATDKDVAQMQEMAQNMGTCPMGQAEVSNLRNGLAQQFGVKISEDAQAGELSLLASVAAAGGNIQGLLGDDGSINADKLMGGVAQVLRNGSKAVNTASDMASGIGLQMNAFRTMINR